jgi:hypothetical protein
VWVFRVARVEWVATVLVRRFTTGVDQPPYGSGIMPSGGSVESPAL